MKTPAHTQPADHEAVPSGSTVPTWNSSLPKPEPQQPGDLHRLPHLALCQGAPAARQDLAGLVERVAVDHARGEDARVIGQDFSFTLASSKAHTSMCPAQLGERSRYLSRRPPNNIVSNSSGGLPVKL